MRWNTVPFILVFVVALSGNAFADAGQAEAQAWYDQVETTNPATKDALTAAERKALLDEAGAHKVAALKWVPKYDPTGDIGFCFGRAMTTHLMARRMGLKGEAIQKLFIFGDLRQGANPEWRFHVTTLVKGAEDGKLYAIDPIFPGMGHPTPLPAADWIEIVRRTWDKPRKAHLVLAERDSIIADMRVLPGKDFETGEKLFEISFNPATKPGFTGFSFGKPSLSGEAPETTVYRADAAAEAKHFLRARGTPAADRYDFLKLEMKILKGPETITRVFDYKSYFIDLLDDLKQPPPRTAPMVAEALDTDSDEPVSLGFDADALN